MGGKKITVQSINFETWESIDDNKLEMLNWKVVNGEKGKVQEFKDTLKYQSFV